MSRLEVPDSSTLCAVEYTEPAPWKVEGERLADLRDRVLSDLTKLMVAGTKAGMWSSMAKLAEAGRLIDNGACNVRTWPLSARSAGEPTND